MNPNFNLAKILSDAPGNSLDEKAEATSSVLLDLIKSCGGLVLVSVNGVNTFHYDIEDVAVFLEEDEEPLICVTFDEKATIRFNPDKIHCNLLPTKEDNDAVLIMLMEEIGEGK